MLELFYNLNWNDLFMLHGLLTEGSCSFRNIVVIVQFQKACTCPPQYIHYNYCQ